VRERERRVNRGVMAVYKNASNHVAWWKALENARAREGSARSSFSSFFHILLDFVSSDLRIFCRNQRDVPTSISIYWLQSSVSFRSFFQPAINHVVAVVSYCLACSSALCYSHLGMNGVPLVGRGKREDRLLFRVTSNLFNHDRPTSCERALSCCASILTAAFVIFT
jgi:hypothetical protein